MKWWSKYRETKVARPSFVSGAIEGCKKRLISFAGYLQERTSRYSARKKKCLLLAFILLFLSASAVIVMDSVTGSKNAVLNIARIKTVTVQKRNDTVRGIDQQEVQKIIRFKKYMDGLSKTAEGKKTRDSLLHLRPHLMDSVNILIEAFASSK